MRRFSLFLIAAFLLSAGFTARAAALDGVWVAHVTRPDGSTDDTFFVLHQNGAELTGRVRYGWGDAPIHDGKVQDGRVTFVLELGDPAKPRRVPWEGEIADGELHLKSMPPNRPAVELVAKPTTASAAAPFTKLPLPALRDLPWNKLAGTPPMGWNSWNKFQGKIDDKTVREIADAMVRTGMLDAGYVYLNIDDTWQGQRDAEGHIHPNNKFPDMKALADYVHDKGLLFGVYSSPGPKTCAGYEGSYGHEAQDAQTYEDWTVDYLKYDWCSAGRIYSDAEMQAAYQKMGEALSKLARPVVFSLCQYGRNDVWKWGAKAGGNLWRVTGDIGDSWDSMTKIGFAQGEISSYAGPGHWNDPDMLEVGNGGMTDDEYRVHMSLWAMLAAPLLAGNDIRTMPANIAQILINKEVIRIDQDKLGKAGTRYSKTGDQEIWTRPLAGGETAVALFNRGEEPAKMTLKWIDFMKGRTVVRDVWKHEFVKVENVHETWTATIPKHGVVLLRLTPLALK
jgi:alpha-galactosidase